MDHNDHHKNNDPDDMDFDTSDTVTWHKVWQVVPEFFRFLKRPFIPTHYQAMNALALSQLALLMMLNIVFSIVAAALIVQPYKEAFDIADSNIGALEKSPLSLFILAVIVAPLLEEICFRGWLKGTRRAFSTIAILLLYAAGLALAINYTSNGSIMLITIFLWSFLIAFDGYFWLRKIWNDMRPLVFFEQYFPIIFYVTAFAFGVMHITNYEHDSNIELLPMIITQCAAGLLFGYIRLRYGLLIAIAIHATYNGALLTLFLAGSSN